MIKRSTRYYLLRAGVVLCFALVCFIGYAVVNTLNYNEISDEDLVYVSYEVLTDNVMPVLKEETSDIIRPYTDENVKIGKSYYDYQKEEQDQEEAIIYYENTYIQNTGVDYTLKEEFDVVAINDGTVISVAEDDIVGKIIKIKHSNNMISVYQSLGNIEVKENDQVTKGQVIAKSGTNSIGSDLGNHLHFELYKDSILVNPEDIFSQSEGE